MEEVKLFGSWRPSPYLYRVILALKLKGISYEFIPEDYANKSALLLQYNPVYKKIPVLVHDGKPISESMIILEYIDEAWPETPLLPKDPYERSTVRFWAKFADEKVLICIPTFRSRTVEDEQRRAIMESLEILKTIEEHAFGQKDFVGGDVIGLADLAFGSITYWLGLIEDAMGIKVMDVQKFPRLHAWTKKFEGVPIIKENLPNRDEALAFFKHRMESILASKPE